ncbi:MAG: hypothetical protein DME12_09980, partial [Candidatus Rokuibacteriota bacterium]
MSIAPPANATTADDPIVPPIVPDISRASAPARVSTLARARVRGKFVFADDAKFYVRGVTYGAFRPDAS